MSQDTSALEHAYRAALYRAHLEEGVVVDITIGKCCQQIDDLCDKYRATSWAFITACNPFSRLVADHENQHRQGLLEALLATCQFTFFKGEGIDQSRDWRPEASFLVLGIDREKSVSYGRVFDQNAIVYGDRGHSAQLLFCTTQQSADR